MITKFLFLRICSSESSFVVDAEFLEINPIEFEDDPMNNGNSVDELIVTDVDIDPLDLEAAVFIASVDNYQTESGHINVSLEDNDFPQDYESHEHIGRPKKGRKRKYIDQNREIRKMLCQTNQSFINNAGKLITPKEFVDYHCKCKCFERISVDIRKREFQRFWALDTRAAKCLFISSNISTKDVKRKRNKQSNLRQFTREYHLANIKICKQLFLESLRISNGRVNDCLKKSRGSEPIQDNRKHGGGRKKASFIKEISQI